MEKQVVFRDRQELQSADLNNIQSYVAASLQHLTQDAVSTALHFTGGLVSAVSATEISVAALRFFNDGKVYVAEQEQAECAAQRHRVMRRRLHAGLRRGGLCGPFRGPPPSPTAPAGQDRPAGSERGREGAGGAQFRLHHRPAA